MMKRRKFLVGGMLAATAAITWNGSKTVPSLRAENIRRDPLFRLSCQLRDWVPGKTVPEKLAQIKAWGIEAVEPHGNVVSDPKTFKKQADDTGLEISVICWGAGNGELCSGDPEERRRGIDKLKKALEASAVLECNGAIYTPAFNKDQQRINRTHQQIRQAMIDIDPNTREVKGGFLKEVGDFAAAMKVNVILEPLNRKESWFLRQVADAASICRDSQSEGVKTMGDFYHMYYEEPCDTGAFLCGGDFIKHVHLGSGNKRILPGQDPAQSFVAGFRGLKMIGYREFMSFECACEGDAKSEIPRCLDFLRKSWHEA